MFNGRFGLENLRFIGLDMNGDTAGIRCQGIKGQRNCQTRYPGGQAGAKADKGPAA